VGDSNKNSDFVDVRDNGIGTGAIVWDSAYVLGKYIE